MCTTTTSSPPASSTRWPATCWKAPSRWSGSKASSATCRAPGSGHLYFTLKDARAQVRCALFKPKSQWLKFVPREGMRVLARGRLTLYEARGDYQLVLDSHGGSRRRRVAPGIG